ncbi:hypothetical protein [Conexibacter woesei]|uniref:Uncharacterized protein n=1 Tax=Conexibacter woesei (strain DSM 14684 / CCUG 47730 / CIP 108061 / JCM 11494 / NBRC 100937 / ID131577) TaxID=469383 RepID=D3F2H1_CONWI|nr:hypothetical protein [Conexibacter woesei]ADB52237.1 hypothetical protein Cwoe_3820 [Conexibacter woesei DSM 14684]
MSSIEQRQFGQEIAEQQPADTTILIAGVDDTPPDVWITMPNAGYLWVAYEYQQQPSTVYVWHQGGSTTPVSPGFSTVQIGAGDALVYSLASPDTPIKLGWAYI